MSQSNWISNLEDLKISCQVLSPQATLLAHHNDADPVVVEGQLQKSVQDSEQLLITLPVLHRVHKLVPPKLPLVPPVPQMMLLQHQHRQ